MDIPELHFLAGWAGVLATFVTGAIIGQRFDEAEWMGGYASFRRRLVRLGHISFVGLGLVNIAFAVTVTHLELQPGLERVSSIGFLAGAATMPAASFLTAYRKRFKSIFVVPVTALIVANVGLFVGWALA